MMLVEELKLGKYYAVKVDTPMKYVDKALVNGQWVY